MWKDDFNYSPRFLGVLKDRFKLSRQRCFLRS